MGYAAPMWIRRFPILLLVFGVNACDECTWGSCDYFPCPASRPYVAAVGHDRRVTPCWDHPFEHSEAVYSAVSEDTSIVTAAIDGFDVILTGVGEGKADVELTATVPFREDSATVVYHVASVLPWIGEITTCDAEEREGYTDVEIEAWIEAGEYIHLVDLTVHFFIDGVPLGSDHFSNLWAGRRVTIRRVTTTTEAVSDHECTMELDYTIDW